MLTMIGIFIGIAAVVSLISLGQGLQNAVNQQFEMVGANVILVMPGAGLESYGMAGSKLTEHDLDLVKKVRGIDLAGGVIVKTAKLEFGDEIKYNYVIGFPTDESQEIFLNAQGIKTESGQEKFKPTDNYKIAVGYRIGHGDFFAKEVKVGDNLMINDKKFRVAAIIGKIGNRQDDSQSYIPMDTAKELFNDDSYSMLFARSKGGFDTEKVADDVKEKIRKDRGLKKGEEDFSVQSYEQIRESLNTVLNIVQAFLVGIAAISLFVGGVGIMNTMYTSVLERTKEIGVMKAIGARNSDVMLIFLIESGILGMVGGSIGCAIGIGFSKTVEFIAVNQLGTELLKADASPELILGALGFSFIVGCLSGVLPARQASQLKPVDALRYE